MGVDLEKKGYDPPYQIWVPYHSGDQLPPELMALWETQPMVTKLVKMVIYCKELHGHDMVL